MAVVMTAWIGGPGALYRTRRLLLRRGFFVAPTAEHDWKEWTGAASVPHGTFGRLTVPRGRATLTLQGDTLTLRTRPRLLRPPPPRSWSVHPDSNATVFVVRGWTFARGIGVRVPGERDHFFWAGPATPDIRAELVRHGFTIPEETLMARYL